MQCESRYVITSCSNVSNLWMPNSNTVPNLFGISNKVLLGTSDWITYCRAWDQHYDQAFIVWIDCYLQLLYFSPLQWLTRDFKYETFREQWIPLNSILSIWSFNERTRSKKITSQKRKSPTTTGRGLTRSTLLQARVYDCITFRNCTLFLCFSTREKEW